jgi:uncharacterized Zn ribbon protein
LARRWNWKEDAVEARKTILTALSFGMMALAGCKGGGEDMTPRLNEANNKVVACRSEITELKTQNAELKRKLAEAMSGPARVQLTDPDILNLIAELKGKRAASNEGDDVVLGKGDLNPKEASRVVRQGAQALQKCYERATGMVSGMNLSPHVDADLTECVRTTVARWKFPPFAGEPVVVTQKLTLTPKT